MPTLASARRHYRLSALLARRAVREARKALQATGITGVTTVVVTHQIAQARASQIAVEQMLVEQEIVAPPEAALSFQAFTTSPEAFVKMVESSRVRVDDRAERNAAELEVEFDYTAAYDPAFERLVESLVQDAARAAESVATAVRPDLGHVRTLTLPSCSRCAVLAGRVYRFSDGFLRHPNCDCVMTPVREGDDTYAIDPLEHLERGQLRGLSKADAQALRDGADFNRVVNVRLQRAGLRESGRVLSRRGRLTPEAIYRASSNRAQAVELLAANGYIT